MTRLMQWLMICLVLAAGACRDDAEEPEREESVGDEIERSAEETAEDLEEAIDEAGDEVDEEF